MAKPPSQLGKSHPKPGRRLATRQVLDLQRVAYDAAIMAGKDAVNPSLDPEQRARAATAVSNLIKAWVSGGFVTYVTGLCWNPVTLYGREPEAVRLYRTPLFRANHRA
jgi:hypothetical protein